MAGLVGYYDDWVDPNAFFRVPHFRRPVWRSRERNTPKVHKIVGELLLCGVEEQIGRKLAARRRTHEDSKVTCCRCNEQLLRKQDE